MTQHPSWSPPDPPSASHERERIEPWALVISVLPLIGIVGGVIALAKGKPRTGGLMILIGVAAFVLLSLLPV